MENNELMVSICCLTYNHKKYIQLALDSFISQKTKFNLEIIVHDDASNDGTTEIIKDYVLKYPKLFKPIYQTNNLYSQGIGIYQIYTQHVFPQAKGKYIAICEGDDYWTDPLKLQKQVDFLEENKEYTLSFHKVGFIGNENTDFNEHEKQYIQLFKEQKEFGLNDLLKENFIPNCSTVYRNDIQQFPCNFNDVIFPDWPLHIIYAQTGKVKMMNELMAIHYVHNDGLWEGITLQEKIQGIIGFYDRLINYLNPEFHQKINKARQEYIEYLNQTSSKDTFINKSNTNNLIVHNLLPHQYEIWDHFVDESPQGDVFCYSWWLETITQNQFQLLAIFENNEIVAGIPLAWYLGKINEPPLTRTLGPLFKNLNHLNEHNRTTVERKWLKVLLEAIPKVEVEQFCTSHIITDWLPFKWKGYKQMTRYTYLIEYSHLSQQDLWKQMNQGRRRMIVKAEKNGIYTKVTESLYDFYKLVQLTYQRQGLVFNFSYNDFKKLDDEINSRNKRLIITAFDQNNKQHAAIYLVFNQKSAYYLLSGGDPEFRHLGGQTLIIWEAIKHFRTKVNYFNFGGSEIEGIETHFRGFGGKLTPYFHIFTQNLIINIEQTSKETADIKELPVSIHPKEFHWKDHVNQIRMHSWVLVQKVLILLHLKSYK